MTSLSVEEALPKAREVLELALRGERIVLVGHQGERVLLARESMPGAELPQRIPGVLAGKLVVGPEFFDPLPDDEIAGV